MGIPIVLLDPASNILQHPWVVTLNQYGLPNALEPSTNKLRLYKSFALGCIEENIHTKEFELLIFRTPEEREAAFMEYEWRYEVQNELGELRLDRRLQPLFFCGKEDPKIILYDEERKRFWCFDGPKRDLSDAGQHWTGAFFALRHSCSLLCFE